MLWIHKFYENELGYRNGEPGKAGRHIELPDAIATAIKRELDTVPIRFRGNSYKLGFQDRPGKECWINKLGEIDPDKSILKPGMLGLFFLDRAETSLVLLDSTDGQYVDVNRVFENNRSSSKRYDAVISSVNYEETEYTSTEQNKFNLPKPFLLLAGISGTGKTRFVREQAKASASLYGNKDVGNHCLVPVRPDWHEPSDLLGYISRIGSDGPRYVATDLLRFIVAAWKHAAESASAESLLCKQPGTICPFWLCLDEMNLAPVEQYFADYLSILETRNWKNGEYRCDPILKSAVIHQLGKEGKDELWQDLGIAGEDPVSSGLRAHFTAEKYGIPLPPNLIVAGTVNMDETTHGFSRKVIDRALTIDFGEFFPNEYVQFFAPTVRPKAQGFPLLAQVSQSDLAGVTADPDGLKTIGFLESINGILKDTPFELAYRALNEVLLSVVCFNPADDVQLQAVWDDFLMMKVLPRIEGDAEKLDYDGEESLLTRLSDVLKKELSAVWDSKRPDMFSETTAGEVVPTFCRSNKKLAWMQERLKKNSFTTFWP